MHATSQAQPPVSNAETGQLYIELCIHSSCFSVEWFNQYIYIYICNIYTQTSRLADVFVCVSQRERERWKERESVSVHMDVYHVKMW